MNVKNREEYRYGYHPFLKIIRLHSGSDRDNFSIRRSKCEVGVRGRDALRVAEKIQNKEDDPEKKNRRWGKQEQSSYYCNPEDNQNPHCL